jgi:hypothetical protein
MYPTPFILMGGKGVGKVNGPILYACYGEK